MKKYSFNRKHVVVTGASGGLGTALARELAERGAVLIITARSQKSLSDLQSFLPEGTRSVAIAADLSKPGQAEYLADKVLEAVGHIDVLFNNAGVGYFALMEETSEDRIRHLFEVNTFSPLVLIKRFLPQMKVRGGGRIVNIVSCAGRVPIPTVGVYGGSKSALAVMANTMRLELEPFDIDVINIYPGTVDTAFEENALREEERSGLCSRESCGLPGFDVANKVLTAAEGPPREYWLEREARWLSTAALIWPNHAEQKLKPLRDKVVKTKSLKERRWRLLQVESAIACNLRCVMCPWPEYAKKSENRGLMTQEIWNAIRPHLSQVQSIDFSGGGEALLQPNLIKWVGEAHGAGCETGILTNGLLLNESKAKKLIDAGIDWICVSMDGATPELYEEIRIGSKFDQVAQNLSALSQLRIEKSPKLMINFVLMSINAHHVEEIIHLAHRLGVDQVNYKQCDVIRGERGKGFGLFADKKTKEIHRLQKALSKARRLAKKLGIHTTAFAFTPSEQPVCDQDPRNSMFIRYDGTVAPCINLALGGPTTFLGREVIMPSVHYGRLPDNDLLDLWESEKCGYYRQQFANRVQAHDDHIIEGLTSDSSPRRLQALQEAKNKMPAAPKGCDVCHYLYDI